jgi:predicted chitinase/phage shock protein PspC (stress-responsive transcriptional regulator)
MKWKISAAIAALCVFIFLSDPSFADPAPASGETPNASPVLALLLLCGLMGLIGQGARAAVGLKTMTTSAASAPSQQTEFNAAYLLISLMIGFIAGVLAGLALKLKIDPSDITVLLGLAAAGYAGTDFIENTLSIFIPGKAADTKSGTQQSGSQQNDSLISSLDSNVRVLGGHVNALADAISSMKSGAPAGTAGAMPADIVPRLAAAFKSCAPRVNTDIWVPLLGTAFATYNLQSNKRMAAAVGQFLVEAGSGFQEVVENLHYSTAARIHQVFPAEFPTVASAEPYVNNPVGLANRAYANKGGNGDEASGDGYLFCGRGLIQLTGRNEYSEFGSTIGKTAEQAAQYCATPAGAATSGCWYLSAKGCLPLADAWAISKITRIVNGAAMLGNDQRIAYANAFLHALGN